ncbi:MAG: energy transducer TonB [Acidobacteriaceae bacterium]
MPIRFTPTQTELDQSQDEGLAPARPEPAEANGSAPPEPSSNVSGPVATFRRSRYEDLAHTDLLHVIEELEGSRNWASLREKLWIALIIHMLIAWYLFYAPKYIYHVRVVDPSVVMKQRQKELTFLDLPPDLRKQPPPKPTNIISDQNRIAQTQHPTIDRKTLEELEAMRRAGQEQRPPSPPQQQQFPAVPTPPQPEVAQQRPPSPPAQPLPQNNQARLEAPPAAPEPNFGAAPANPNEQIQQAMRNAMRSGQYGGDGGAGLTPQHPGLQSGVEVLSDTMGWDYGPYVQRVIADTKRAWYPIIPEEARPPLNKQGKVLIRFRIQPDGTVVGMSLEGPSGDVALDRSAWGGITGAAPFPPLPKAFKGPYLDLRFYFLYNIMPGQE